MTMDGKTILITGANRGIGHALMEQALRRGAARVYAGTRQPLADLGPRVTALTLDVTSAAQIQKAARQIGSLDILINNAGIQPYDDLTDRATIERSLEVNVFGTHAVTQAFVPALSKSSGAVVNVLSVLALAPLPLIPAYSASKAAAFSMTQSLRTLLAGRGVRVHAVLTGPVDTDMTRDFDIPKAPPQSIAEAIFDGIDNGEEDIFPDPVSLAMADGWRNSAAKAFERQNAAIARTALAQAVPVTA